MLDAPTVAYVAGILDTMAVIRTRMAAGTELPYLALSGSNAAMLQLMADLTGTKAIVTRRSYARAGCAEHCKEKHQHIVSLSGRWSASGVKATVVLHSVLPYLRLQRAEAAAAVDVGLRTGFKPATVRKMADLGWDVPEFDDHYKRR